MSEPRRPETTDDEAPRPGESFLSRFHRRKTQARLADAERLNESDVPPPIKDDAVSTPPAELETSQTEPHADQTLPALETLGADSDYTGFLSPKVDEALRRAALRKLFHGTEFNFVDGLDEYAEDYTQFEALGDLITVDMRHQFEVEAKRQLEAAQATEQETDPGSASIDETGERTGEQASPEEPDALDPIESATAGPVTKNTQGTMNATPSTSKPDSLDDGSQVHDK